jgi:hypothetical protein
VQRALRSNKTPQMMEYPVNPELGPFLVSSTRSVLWVDRVSRDSRVRAAVRARRGIEQDVLAAIIEMGTRAEWGNIHPLTSGGVAECVKHLNAYGLEELECLVSASTSLEGVAIGNLPMTVVEWMPKDCLVVLPLDRGFVGTMGLVSDQEAMVVVHNASRGVAIAWR